MRFILRIRYNLLSFDACIIEKSPISREEAKTLRHFGVFFFINNFKTLFYELQCINTGMFSNNICI